MAPYLHGVKQPLQTKASSKPITVNDDAELTLARLQSIKHCADRFEQLSAHQSTGHHWASCNIAAESFSASIITGALRLPLVISGMMEASMIRRLSNP